jgi:hypothetical protein
MPSGTEPSGRHRVVGGRLVGRHRRGRVREILQAGLIDSFGLSLGWTTFTLIAVMTGGLAEAALYNAAMLAGTVLAAPATAWLAHRFPGRTLVRAAAATEAVLRLATLLALLAGWPSPVVAAGVVLMYVAAYAGYAAMRAEVAAADSRAGAMTGYALCIAAVEAGGAGVAALLPFGADGRPPTGVLVLVGVVYTACLIPTVLTAARARVQSTRTSTASTPAGGPAAGTGHLGLLAGGGLITFLGSGPTLLSVALAADLHGPASVAGAAIAFSVGALLSPVAVQIVTRLRLPAAVTWPLLAAGMLAGWTLAPVHVAGLFVAQLLAGLSLTAFEGIMDARVAARTAAAGTTTTMLAWSAATRALGSALAVKAVPLVIAAAPVAVAAGTVTGALIAVAGLVGAVTAAVGALRRADLRDLGNPERVYAP